MLRILITSAVIAASIAAASAYAQTEDVRTLASNQIFAACSAHMAQQMDAPANAVAQCRCFASLALEDWSEREVTLFARVFSHYPDQDAARAEMESMIANEGYTMADYQSVTQKVGAVTERVGDRCEGATE